MRTAAQATSSPLLMTAGSAASAAWRTSACIMMSMIIKTLKRDVEEGLIS